MANKQPAAISTEAFFAMAERDMPFMSLLEIEIVQMEKHKVIVRSKHREDYLRPGGTIAGPVMMGLADVTFYAAILANIGMVELAVTTNLNINFLRKPPPGDLLASGSILKLGKRLVVCECSIYSETLGDEKLVAHATGTYSIPINTG